MPSILDGLPQSEDDVKQMFQAGEAAVSALMRSDILPAPSRKVIAAMAEGLSKADILGITRQERDALLVQGIRQIQQGDLAGARVTLTGLLELEPTDARVIYALGAAYQAQQDYRVAGRLYLNFLAFEATDPQGYLRLAECFLGNGEAENAAAYVEAAEAIAAETPAAAAVAAYAKTLRGALAARAAAA